MSKQKRNKVVKQTYKLFYTAIKENSIAHTGKRNEIQFMLCLGKYI